MAMIEDGIKEFVRSRGVPLVGIAGPGRFDGPPSLDPGYIMRGARSIVSMAIPMDVPAIDDFLSKKTPFNHNRDQLLGNQRIHRAAAQTADYIRSLGHRARAVPPNNTYRRSPDPFATHPSFSHRFGALVAGIAGQGLSGNVVTREFGAAVYLGTVVTDAVLRSDPAIPPREIFDSRCATCLICDKACPSRMFIPGEEEQVLLNGDLYPRGKRRSLDLCNASCFGLHGLSLDRHWSSWGIHWINRWTEAEPDPSRDNIRMIMLRKGGTVGDSFRRYNLIRHLGSRLYPEQALSESAVGKKLAQYPADELERTGEHARTLKRHLGVSAPDPNVLTCGHCALVCGPTIAESARRLRLLREGGIVVRGEGGRTVVVRTYEEARELRRRYPVRVPRMRQLADSLMSGALWIGLYWGIDPAAMLRNARYRRRLKRSVGAREKKR